MSEMNEKNKNIIIKWITHPYSRFLQKKILFYLVVLVTSITLIFLIPRYMPGDPATRILPPKSPFESVEDYDSRVTEFNEYYGFDKPILEQYRDFWVNLFHGDLGLSTTNPGKTANEVLSVSVIFTFAIVIPVVVISFFLGNWIGARSAYSKSKTNKFVYYFALLSQSAPFYWMALIFFWYLFFSCAI